MGRSQGAGLLLANLATPGSTLRRLAVRNACTAAALGPYGFKGFKALGGRPAWVTGVCSLKAS